VVISPNQVERIEERLWEAVRALYGPGTGHKVEAAAEAVAALAAYRIAVEESSTLSPRSAVGAATD
jgi:hypothetical protein